RCRLGHIQSETEREVTIAFPTLGFANNARERLKDLLPVAQELLGREVKLSFVAGMPSPASPPAEESATVSSPPPPPSAPVETEAIASAPPTPRQPAPPPPSATPLTPDDPDDLHRAARKLADFFSGSIVDASDPAIEAEDANSVAEPVREEASVGAITPALPTELEEEDELPF
ncbi:MAG: hypothetical protein AAFY15_17150, partial [Cyanobacteria bacterium J06648_11]